MANKPASEGVDPPIPERRGPGRPKGSRNKATREIKELAGKHSTKALKEVVSLLKDDDAKVRHAAARTILEYAHGKPTTTAEISGKDGAPLAAVTAFLAGLPE